METQSLESKHQLAAFLVDILHYDIESMQSLISHLNEQEVIGWRRFWSHDFTEEELLPVLEDLINENFIQVLQLNDITTQLEKLNPQVVSIRDRVNSLWFALTEKGHLAWKEWTPPE